MRGQDDAGGEKHLDRRRRETIEPALYDIAAIPVLLALATFVFGQGTPANLPFRLTMMAAIGERNLRQWLSGRQVCTAPQSWQRQRFIQSCSGIASK